MYYFKTELLRGNNSRECFEGFGLFVGPALRIQHWKNRGDGEIREQKQDWQ